MRGFVWKHVRRFLIGMALLTPMIVVVLGTIGFAMIIDDVIRGIMLIALYVIENPVKSGVVICTVLSYIIGWCVDLHDNAIVR